MMAMQKANWWFSPSQIKEENNELASGATRVFAPGSQPITKASTFSIHMRGVYISRSLDPPRWGNKEGSTNDLLVVSSFQTGTAPTVQRVHYLKYGQRIKEWVGDFFNTRVCSFSDFQENHITLHLQVYDIDDYNGIKDLFSAASTIGNNIAITFPVLSPYTAAASAVGSSVVELLNTIDQHDSIMDANLRLETGEENVGSNILQTGHWLFFEKPQDSGLQLSPNLQVIGKDGEVFSDCSYAIYSIHKEETQEPEWEVDQRAAKLLSELGGKGNSGRAAIEFLRDTIDGYGKFKKLKRLRELERKSAKERSQEENDVLQRLRSDETLKFLLMQ
jgi:hypothetical protein